MKYNKGFAPLIVLLIVLGVLVVGGAAYSVGKKSAPKNETVGSSNNFPVPKQSSTPPTSESSPSLTTSCAPSITVLSPNGGEVYKAGQQITVKWKSCNLKQQVGITLSGFPVPSSTQFFLGNWVPNTIGSQVVTIPATAQSGKYMINISTPPNSSHGVEDWSNNYFTI